MLPNAKLSRSRRAQRHVDAKEERISRDFRKQKARRLSAPVKSSELFVQDIQNGALGRNDGLLPI